VKDEKAEFCRSLSWAMDFKWLDLTGLVHLQNGNVATVELAERGTSGDYPGFQARVTNPSTGEVASKFFAFDDYMDASEAARTDIAEAKARHPGRDEHPAYPGTPGGRCYVLIAHCGWRWYIAEPKDETTKPYCAAVETFLKAYQGATGPAPQAHDLAKGPSAFGLRQVDGEPGVMLGTQVIFGTSHHVYAFRVKVGDDGCQSADGDPHRRFSAYAIADEQCEPYCTVKLPGRSGEWVLFITPYQD
jgi:hypothetical protein